VPRDFTARANHAVQRHRGNGLEVFHNYTAIGALMAGCGS
jgi:hypothetical protein